MITDKENLWSARIFLIGIILAVVAGIISVSLGKLNPVILGALAIIGFFVGFMTSYRDVSTFLMASVSLVIVSFAGASGIKGIEFLEIELGNIISSVLGALLVMLIPATIVVAIKSLFSISRR